jgi:hypothetical protein
MNTCCIIFSIIFILMIVIILIITYIGNKKLKQSQKSIKYTFYNNLYDEKFPKIQELTIPIQNEKVYNIDVAKYCADLILRISNTANKISPEIYIPKGQTFLKNLINIKDTSTFGVMYKDSNNIVWISFRGTINTEEMIQDLNYTQNSLDNYQNSNVQRSLNLKGIALQPQIHEGFLDVYNNIKNDMFKVLDGINPSQIIVSGHSLGAGVATIAGVDLVNKGYNTVVYNFASPRVGDSLLKDFVEKNLTLFRFVNNSDIIPSLPPSVSPNFNDVKKPYFYIHCGKPFYMTQNWKSINNNHTLGVYIDGLTKDLYK